MKSHRSLFLPAAVLLSTLVVLVQSSPLALVETTAQTPLVASDSLSAPRYDRGELPPLRDTEGWIDPRLNGGRFLDVRHDEPRTELGSHHSLVYNQKIRRTSQHNNIFPFRPVCPGRVGLARLCQVCVHRYTAATYYSQSMIDPLALLENASDCIMAISTMPTWAMDSDVSLNICS